MEKGDVLQVLQLSTAQRLPQYFVVAYGNHHRLLRLALLVFPLHIIWTPPKHVVDPSPEHVVDPAPYHVQA